MASGLKTIGKTCVFIDGSSLYSTSRNLNFDVDYKKLLEYLERETGSLVRTYYYAAIVDTDDYSPLKPLTDWLSYNGYSLVTKTAREFTDATGKRRVKGNMDIEIAIDMMEMAPHVDNMIIFTGDSDFRRAVEAVQRQGVSVTAVSSRETSPPLIGDDLRRQVDHFVDLHDISKHFIRATDKRDSHPNGRYNDTSFDRSEAQVLPASRNSGPIRM
ncbi:NYN domain-containing protein [Acetobacter pasteurianus]|uniref:NYN domain-containing protein n=1 Tax=Acetobacter pasteurianus NBRC 3278 TaxID=1226660 RepID=A0A401X7U1_ACEPA|nr:NYN domain-containing protein [Acetobacter pasteurianus]GCD60304.1 hypothetical protein NBRC3277_2879 [Acetobacter pasteurianus NBRC 3277]GCD63813.1 hypothetical protein NBRC3278_2906 [Acetobacter pasteurianus NBRC 3278]GCD70275.1 hypothetical protein NBRC3280_2910 [Acetobacter pasteurianus NBRC 3280]GLH29638.1 NYN domain-containing protein [Acetobacter pasteurianus]